MTSFTASRFHAAPHAAMASMAADAPPFRASDAPTRKVWCKLHHETTTLPRLRWANTAELKLELPLQPTATDDLERLLQQKLSLPAGHTVFTIRRLDEIAAPVLPLVLLHGLVAPDENSVEIAVEVRPVAQAGAPPPRAPLPSLDLAALDGAELLRRLRTEKVARLRMDPALLAAVRACKAALPAFFAEPEAAKERLATPLRPDSTDRRYAGPGSDRGREWLQLRQAREGSALPAGAPDEIAAAFSELRRAAVVVLRALAGALGASAEAWLAMTDVDDEGAARIRGAGGPSVLRAYRYKAGGCGCHAHADLGMLSLSPAPVPCRAPGLLVYDPEHLCWVDAEEGLAEDEMTVFVGETLSRLTKGALPAPLHRVPPPIVDGRLALPLFVRAHPHARLGATTAEEFVVEHLFRRRPWRPSPPNGSTPDF